MTAFLARLERFERIGSTNDAVRGWLADGTPEVCLAVADEQTAGRGRAGRTWVAPPGAALLLSVGFRPSWLDPSRAWRLAAVVSLAMADAAEEAAGLRDGAVRLKWPNDLVIEEGGSEDPRLSVSPLREAGDRPESPGDSGRRPPSTEDAPTSSIRVHPERGAAPSESPAASTRSSNGRQRGSGRPNGLGGGRPIGLGGALGAPGPGAVPWLGRAPGLGAARLRKVGGVLGQADGLGGVDPRVVVGIGINVDWDAATFPEDLAAGMTSLRQASGGRPVDRDLLLEGFLSRLEARVEALRTGRFAVGDWAARQVTSGRLVRLEGHGREPEDVLAVGVDPASGALLVDDPGAPGGERPIHAGDVVHVRVATAGAGAGGPTGAGAGGPTGAGSGGPTGGAA